MSSTDSANSNASHSSDYSSDASASLLLGALSPRRAIIYALITAAVTSILLIRQDAPMAIALLAGASYAFLAVNAAIDSQTKKLVPLWTHCAGALCLIACAILAVQGQSRNVIAALVCALLLSGISTVLNKFFPASLGAGDARIIAVLGAWVALRDPISLIGMFIIAGTAQLGAFGIVNAQRGGYRWRDDKNGSSFTLPFGPSLTIGSWCALIMAFAGNF